VRKTDILIFDDAIPRGWTAPSGWALAYRSDKHFKGEIPPDIRSGRFGVLSGGRLCTTWRALAPLADEAYLEGNTTIYEHHVSNVLTSPFEIKLPYLTFLLSGGNAPGVACVNLLVDPASSSSNAFNAARAEVVRSATGRNDDMLEWVAFNVTDYVGRYARIQVLDTGTAAFDYITIDCVCQSPDTKGAVRVIATPPTKAVSNVETVAGKRRGPAVINKGRLLVGGQPVNLQDILSWDTGAEPGDATGRRVELVNGDSLSGTAAGLEEGTLILDHAIWGKTNLPLSSVAQALFAPGPSVDAEPGTLIHANGNKIPGELSWIREDNISLKCALGQLPLPRGRVRAFVFAAGKPAAAAAAAAAARTVTLTDGTRLSGKLALEEDQMVLIHTLLGPMKLALSDIERVTQHQSGALRLVDLNGKVSEGVGLIAPPAPQRLKDGSGDRLRIFPRTVVRYDLPKVTSPRHFRGVLAPVPNARQPMQAHVRVGKAVKTYTVQPGGDGVAVDLDLGTATAFELVADATSPLSYPCGIEWRNAIIVGGAK
jgi:hypothetical protein